MPATASLGNGQRSALGDEVAHHLQAVLAADGHVQHPDQVVDPGDAQLEIFGRRRRTCGSRPLRTPNNSWHSPTVLTCGATVLTTRVSTVIGLVRFSIHAFGQRALHGLGDVGHDRHVAQRARQATRPDRVADRLVDPVLLGNGQIQAHRVEAAGGDRDDDELGAVQSLLQVGRRLDGEVRARAGEGFAAVALNVVQRSRVDVVQHDGAFEIGRQRQVTQQLGHPVVAATANETDLCVRHVSPYSALWAIAWLIPW